MGLPGPDAAQDAKKGDSQVRPVELFMVSAGLLRAGGSPKMRGPGIKRALLLGFYMRGPCKKSPVFWGPLC